MKRTGIFGGSFDPVHVGHLKIARSFLDCGLIDSLLILPAPHAPHKKGRAITSYSHRFEMLRIAFEGWENVKISDIEQKLFQVNQPCYTIDTIRYLQENCRDTLWFLCIGGDSLVQLHSWKGYQEILSRVTLLVAERPGFEAQNVKEEILEKTIFVDHEPVNMSSTEVRKYDDKKRVPPGVLTYIQTMKLYQS